MIFEPSQNIIILSKFTGNLFNLSRLNINMANMLNISNWFSDLYFPIHFNLTPLELLRQKVFLKIQRHILIVFSQLEVYILISVIFIEVQF